MDVKTSRHIGSVLKYTHALMAEAFVEHMSLIAASQPSRFHHVYEWGQVGDPTARLWTDKLVGGGNNRIASFQWKASKQVVPVRDDFKELGVKQIHVFVWKAPVMEYGKNIKIEPKRSKLLVFFTGPTNPEGKYKIMTSTNSIRVTDPGGPLTKGSFTKAYIAWWGGEGASTTFDTKIRRVLEEDLGRMPIEEVTGRFRRARKKTITMQALGDYEAAKEAGAAAARKYLQSLSGKYIEQAKARERLIYGE